MAETTRLDVATAFGYRAGVFVYRSNSLKELVDCLSHVIREPLPQVLCPEVVLIQSAGMERYLSRELARRNGILAGTQFPFPRAFIREILDAALGKEEKSQLYDRELMSWILFDELSYASQLSGFEAIALHLKEDEGSSRRLYLAERLAHLFDQYLTYRPEMVISWQESGPDDSIQAKLWQRLTQRVATPHFAERCRRFVTDLSDEQLRSVLPTRISLFGGPGLPPLFLHIFARMAKVVPVHLFALTASQHYYFETSSAIGTRAEAAEEHGHPLLGALGRVGGDFQHLLEGLGGYQEGGAPFARHVLAPTPAAEPVQLTNLQLLRNSLLDGVLAQACHRIENEHADDSITIDVCHSRLREVETLRDRLLTWFAEDPKLRPEDVAVLVPDIDNYSALIEAVFSGRAGESPTIPHRIFDRSLRKEDAGARALLMGLALLKSRFKVGDVLDLLQLEPVRSRYSISATDLERLTDWLGAVNTRCNVDAAHRESLGLPSYDENTWRFGLRRLLLGYLTPDNGTTIFHGDVPYDDVAVSDGPRLGRLCELFESLFALREQLVSAGPEGLSLADWCEFLVRAAEALIAESREGAWDLGALRQSLYEIEERRRLVGRNDASAHAALRLGHEAMVHLLEKQLEDTRYSSDFLSGGVTFCALLPLRTVPFLRICVLGLNQGQFPRNESLDPLNLMLREPKPGDRSLRSDDRYLFLELLLSAQHKISFSYVGRSIQDNSVIPPSVLLGELESAVARLDDGSRQILVRVHPLQPFHPSYFNGQRSEGRPISFEPANYQGALALVGSKTPPPQLLAGPLPVTSIGTETQLADLVRFFKDPAAQLLRHCGIGLDQEGSSLVEREPIELDALERHQIGEHLLAQLGTNGSVSQDVEMRRGTWPLGQGGRLLFEEFSLITQEIAQLAKQLRQHEVGRFVGIELAIPCLLEPELQRLFEYEPAFQPALGHYESLSQKRVLLSGSLGSVYGNRRLVTSFGRATAKRRLSLFIEHLAICAQDVDFQTSLLLARPEQDEGVSCFGLRRVQQSTAQAIISQLICLRYLGFHYPLPFFPKYSLEFAAGLAAAQTKGSAASASDSLARTEREIFRERGRLFQLYRDISPLRSPDCQQRPAEELPFVRLAVFVEQLLSSHTLKPPEVAVLFAPGEVQ